MKSSTTAWAHLPNAALIVRIIADAFLRPEAWEAAPTAAEKGEPWGGEWEAWDMACSAALEAVQGAARNEALHAAWLETPDVASNAVLALVAWDDAALMLVLPVPALRLMASEGNHAAVLMLPAVIALTQV